MKNNLKEKFLKFDENLDELSNWIINQWPAGICLIAFWLLIVNIESLHESKSLYILRLTAMISAIFSGILIGYLVSFSIQIRREKVQRIPKIFKLTQQVHNYRRILSILLHMPKFWQNDLYYYMKKYENVSFFDIREMVNSEGYLLAKTNEYFEDRTHGNIRQLFLEIRCLVGKKIFDQTLMSDYESLHFYKEKFVSKWLEHRAGEGIWYFLVNHKNDFEDDVDFSVFNEENHKYACALARTINKERFENFQLDAENLAELGAYMVGEVFQNLHLYQQRQLSGLPNYIIESYILLSLIIFFGVLIPISMLLTNANFKIIIWSSAITIVLSLYIILKIFNYMKRIVK